MNVPNERAPSQGGTLDLDLLNPDQLDAVVHRGGPLLVVAGAGSGKTRVLTHRIAHLIDEGVPPIRDPGDHVHQQGGRGDAPPGRRARRPGPKAMWVSTFHSACVRILRAEAERLGYPRNFSIYDAADAQRLTGYVIRDLRLDSKRFPPARRARPDQPVEERAGQPRRRPWPRRRTRSSASTARSTSSTRPACTRPGRWTSTTC